MEAPPNTEDSSGAAASSVATSTAPTTTTSQRPLLEVNAIVAVPQPDVKNRIVFNTTNGGYIYDVDTQKYYGVIAGNWYLLHQTPQTTVEKPQARKLIKKFPTLKDAVKDFPTLFNIQPSVHLLLNHEVIVYNAIHDSILVKRDKSITGLHEFYGDKLLPPTIPKVQLYCQFLRPIFYSEHQCIQRQMYGSVSFCSTCLRFQYICTVPATETQPEQQSLSMLEVGKLVIPKSIVDMITMLHCVDQKTGKFTVEGTFLLLNELFFLSKPALSNLQMPKDVLIEWLFRDCLFVKHLGQVYSWLEYFKVSKSSFTASDAVGLVRIALAIGTLGTIS